MNPQDHLMSASYRFNQIEMNDIVQEYFRKKIGFVPPYSLSYSDEDDEGCCWISEDDVTDEQAEALDGMYRNWTEGYDILRHIMEEYMRADVQFIKAYEHYSGHTNGTWNFALVFHVEVDAGGYVAHDAIHEWGFSNV